MANFLKILFFWVWVLFSSTVLGADQDALPEDLISEKFSVELQLLDIHLGIPYEKAKALLTQKYGEPVESGTALRTTNTFKLDPKRDSFIKILTQSNDPSVVGEVVVFGTEPIPGLNFFSNANLGDLEKDIHLKFPKAKMEQKENHRRYGFPFANYFLEVKNGKVVALGIWNPLTFPVKARDDSIALSFNLALIAQEKGWLTEEGLLSKPEDMAEVKALVLDPLRPYCKERYPLRQTLTGMAYIDVNVYKSKQAPPIPATFLLDTGWVMTSLSPELCKKLGCKNSKATSSASKFDDKVREAPSGFIVFGGEHCPTDKITIVPPTLRHDRKDGVLGNIVLFFSSLFVSYKHGYLCFPSLSLFDVAQKLKLSKLSPRYFDPVVRTDFYVNNQRIENVLLDSGADTTSLSKKNIATLKLKSLNKSSLYHTARGTFRRSLYGPVEVGWPNLGLTQNLKEIAESDDGDLRVGIDFLRYTILGLYFEETTVFFGFYLGK